MGAIAFPECLLKASTSARRGSFGSIKARKLAGDFPRTTSTAIADTAPKFDIARVCQSEGGSNVEQKRCADDETQARDTLQTEWTQFTPSAKKQCSEETNIESTPRYLQSLT